MRARVMPRLPAPVQRFLDVENRTYYAAAGEKERPLLTEAQLKQVAQLILSRE